MQGTLAKNRLCSIKNKTLYQKLRHDHQLIGLFVNDTAGISCLECVHQHFEDIAQLIFRFQGTFL